MDVMHNIILLDNEYRLFTAVLERMERDKFYAEDAARLQSLFIERDTEIREEALER